MKHTYKLIDYVFATVIATTLLFFTSCETTELEILDSPNALTPEEADIDLFLNSIQVGLAAFFDGDQLNDNAGISENGMEVTRILHAFGPIYDNIYLPSRTDILYQNAYAGPLIDGRTMIPLAEEAELYTHIGISQVVEAYIIMGFVDLYGPVPYSEALQGADFLNPNLDSGQDVYEAVESLLNQAIENFNRDEASLPANDLYYDGDESKWIKLANTLKLKLYIQTRLVDSDAGSKINALLSEGNLILTTDDDFEFQYSTTDANPDSRHPIFGRNFDVAADVTDYMSNSYMTLVKDDYTDGDPRTRYYFYRQSLDFTMDPNENECITIARPIHYSSSDTYCNPGDGYWGRDHLDNDGIPPDGGLRTTWGVYPIGGLFDDQRGTPIPGRDIGLQGAGISPIMLSSFTNFMLAEGALTIGVDGDARGYLEEAVRQSISKVVSFGERLDYLDNVVVPDDPDTDADEERTIRDFYVPSNDDIEDYVEDVLERYDSLSGNDRLELVVIEYFKALYGNGLEAYNTYRRTGFPSMLQPALEPQPGEFINSFLYPQELFQQNSNVDQKPNQAVRVFWAEGGPTVD
ncbi:SusD/RagB family nutrient-binding outer membrane lipoprotein [Aquimarina sp. ERC-38]|uniref:SusD/RagB family nutrient-binding outer membrane lipoprotein n=1 Tax=Aquimarina sp. ERC-38 TaxID=2949996 RepID=UPI002246507B|nr:SusD/RagB family nutrient-binding outer membrane lipoprotein [Aquimarina sp. ERC-38]UZO79186.1 SusD/RagB family nutrient-binding outer membrane lipoprotein [Aquimarina sp. ERC-38]